VGKRTLRRRTEDEERDEAKVVSSRGDRGIPDAAAIVSRGEQGKGGGESRSRTELTKRLRNIRFEQFSALQRRRQGPRYLGYSLRCSLRVKACVCSILDFYFSTFMSIDTLCPLYAEAAMG
jgi:hypothetical protein